MNARFKSANMYYSHFVSSEVFYNFEEKFLITDGIFEVAGAEELFWFVKLIADAQDNLNNFQLQNWLLKRVSADHFTIETTDITGEIIFTQTVYNCRFSYDEIIVCVADKLIMLPGEYLSATRSQLKITANPYYLRYQLVELDLPNGFA